MNKIILGIIGLLLTSAVNIGFLLPSKSIKNDNNLSILFMRVIFIITGLISFLSFFIPGLKANKNILSNIKTHLDYKLIIYFAVILFLMNIFILLAINKGGPISFIIINFNVGIVILFGILFNKDPVDFKLILSLIIFLLVGIYTIIHQNELKLKLK